MPRWLWFLVQEEEGGAQDGDHGRQAGAEHAQQGGRQHHLGTRFFIGAGC